MIKGNRGMILRRTVLIITALFFLALRANAEDIKAPSAKTGEIHGNQLLLGVTDDANKNLMMLRMTPEGYLKASLGTALSSNADSISCLGNVANDSVDAGNPVKVGMRANIMGATLTTVADGDRVDWIASRQGVPFVITGNPNMYSGRANYTTAQTNAVLVTIGAGAKIVVTGITVSASNANTVNTSILIGFGTTTTPTSAGVVLAHPGLGPGQTVSIGNGGGILGIGALDEDLRITSSVPTTGSIDVVIQYYNVSDN